MSKGQNNKQNQSRKKREEVLNNLIDVKKSTLYFPNYLTKNKAQTPLRSTFVKHNVLEQMAVINGLHNSLKLSKFDNRPEEGSRSAQPRRDRTTNELHGECRQRPYKGPTSSEPPMSSTVNAGSVLIKVPPRPNQQWAPRWMPAASL